MNERAYSGSDTYRRLLQVSKRYWITFLFGMTATIILSLSDAGFAWLIEPIVNRGFINREGLFIKWLPALIIFIFIIRAISSFCSSYFIARVSRSVVMDFRQQLFRHLLKLPAKFYDQSASGKILSAIVYNVEQVAQASSDVLVTVLRETTLIFSLVAVMFVVNWRLSVIFAVIMPLIAWGIKITSQRLRKLSTNVQSSIAEVSHIANEGIEAYRVIRLFAGQQYEINKFDHATKTNRHQELKVEVTNSVGTSVIQLMIAFPLAAILYFSTSPALGVNAGSFAAIISSLIMLIRPIRRVTSLNNFIQKGIAGAESIFKLLDEEVEKDTGTVPVTRVQGKVVFENVSFSYKNSTQAALHNVSFEVKPAQTIAIVGHSGSGKTTLISLLPRFYDLEQGAITIDGINIRDYKLEDLRAQFALVSQHTVLFNDTVARNIAYAQGEAINQERLIQAARSANALEFIENMPRQFETVVGEDGVLLSGGQRQRLAIARALYKQAPILILDEATASLDTQSERLIQSALDTLMRQCTTLVIAHRLSTIENANWILVMDKGRIVESGVHQELLVRGGVYADLHRMQFSVAETV